MRIIKQIKKEDAKGKIKACFFKVYWNLFLKNSRLFMGHIAIVNSIYLCTVCLKDVKLSHLAREETEHLGKDRGIERRPFPATT